MHHLNGAAAGVTEAHAVVEWVDCAQVVQAAEFYRRFLMEFKAELGRFCE